MNRTRKRRRVTFADSVYSNEEYSSNDGMLTSVWGPGMWHYMHTMSFNYPVNPTETDKRNYKDFILNLKNVLPCGKCRANLRKNFKRLPLTMKDMKSRDTFSRYIYNLHELINKMLNKSSGLSYEDVRERYEHFRARCVQPLSKINSKTCRRTKKIENGCTEPLYGEKAKCVLKIVPHDVKCDTLQIDSKCVKKKLL
jgi:hypothetical protein